MNNEHPARSLDTIFRNLFESGEPWPAWFNEYCGSFQDPCNAKNYVGFIRYLLDRAGIKPNAALRAIDAGSGFGPLCYVFHLLGFGDVHGLEIFEPMHKTFARSIEILGYEKQIHAHQGDAISLASLWPKNSIDVVTSLEAISHMLEPDAFFSAAHTVLKPGGHLIISDSNTPLCKSIRVRNRMIWDRFENGPEGKIFDTHVDKSYKDIRKDLISEAYPALSDEECVRLSLGTSYMTGDQVLAAARDYIDSGKMPDSFFRPNGCPINPESNMYLEREFVPADLAKSLNKMGFNTKWGVYLGNPEASWKLACAVPLCDLLSRFTQYFIPNFYVIAAKRG